MSRRSVQRRQSRREKQVRKWAGNENAPLREQRGVALGDQTRLICVPSATPGRVNGKPTFD